MKAQPLFASPYSSVNNWLANLDRLEALKPVLIVPSHGPTGDVGFISAYRSYLTDVRQRIVSGRTKSHELYTLLPWNWRLDKLSTTAAA